MISGARLIGEEISSMEIAKEFKEAYKRLKVSNIKETGILSIKDKFFSMIGSLALQFDAFICLFSHLKSEKPLEVNKVDGFEDFIVKLCGHLSIISNLIIFPLNNHIIDGEVFNIIEMPYDGIFDKNLVRDENKLKEVFKTILNSDVENLFPLIIALRDNFFNSNLYKGYITALKTDKNIKHYEIAVQALFYIIKQVIYQQIRDGQIVAIDESNMIKFNASDSLEGNFFKIKYQPPPYDPRIMEIKFEGENNLAITRSSTFKSTPKKGHIINIEGEFLSKEGLNINSPVNDEINEYFNKVGHWYRFIDNNYRGLD